MRNEVLEVKSEASESRHFAQCFRGLSPANRAVDAMLPSARTFPAAHGQ
jgi:hypothetical protein